MEHDDIDEDIERLNIILQDDDGEDAESDGELRILENNEEEYYSNASRPSTSSDVTASSFPTTSVCTDADDAMFRFDPHTITAETCLAMNRAYQEVLLDTLRQIEISLIENRTRQRELEESVDKKVKKSDKQTNKDGTEYKIGGLPYFKDKSGNMPPFNEDVKLKEQMNEEKQHVRPKSSWTKKQRKELVDAVKLDAMEQALRPLLSKQEVEMEKLSRCKNSEEITEAKDRIEKLQQEIRLKQNTPGDDLLKTVDNNKIDFLKISCSNFNNKFSASECMSMWNAVLQPGINRSKWTAKEEEELIKLAEKYQKRNWDKIAEELKSNRTPYQCLQHFQENHFASVPIEWTEEEDELLKEVVETCTFGKGRIKWHQVAYYIDGKSADHCRSRWNRIDPNRTLGRWTKEEDMQLLDGIQIQGGVLNWAKIQEHVPTRSANQCRERFVSRMSGDILYKQWTYEDDKKLLMLYEDYGSNWVKIAQEFEGRSDNMVLLRHQRLVKWQRMSEAFFSQPVKVQRELKHQAFRILRTGEVVPKPGLLLRLGRNGAFRNSVRPKRKQKYKSEIQRLKDIGGRLTADLDADNDDEVKDDSEDEDDDDNDDDDEEEMDKPMKLLQDSLDAFAILYNIEAHDYFKQIVDRKDGDIVVPRPPPIKKNKMNLGLSLWKKHDCLHNVVAAQIDLYVKQLQEKLHEGSDGSTAIELNLYEQISKNIKIGSEDKRQMIAKAFKGKNPCNLSVRELLNISRCIKDHGKPPKDAKHYDVEPWEVETSEEEKGAETSSESENEEDFQEEEEEPKKKKRPLSEKQKAHHKQLSINMKNQSNINYQIKHLVLSKMDSREVNKRVRRKQFLMYPKSILMKYKGLDEERRMNRKSLVLLMKSLDFNSRKAYFKAWKGKRKLSALAMLKATEKFNLRRAKTRRQKQEIQEAAKSETNINTELSEVSEYLLDLNDELKINVNDNANIEKMLEEEENLQDRQHYGYNKSLPYIPPNRTNLLGMKTLLLEHRSLIDQAGLYFNTDELKKKLYVLKERGPNPLMSVLNAIGKTESAARKRDDDRKYTPNPKVCKKQMDDVRKTTAYKKLKARFQSIFTWPALLATIQPPKGNPLPLALQDFRQKSEVVEEPQEPEVVLETENVEEDLDGLPEEEAVEKLVDKIMEEYEKERAKRKRHLTTKKHRNFSEKRKKAFVDKERTKILKRLGLFEKMQEFKRRRLEAAQGNVSPTPSLPSTSNARPSATSTVTSSTTTSSDVVHSQSSTVTSSATEFAHSLNVTSADSVPSTSNALVVAEETDAECKVDVNEVSAPSYNSTDMLEQLSVNDTSAINSNVIGEPMTTSESCQDDLTPDDPNVTPSNGKAGTVGKRKRGRPAGSKTKCYSNTSPVRKSHRTADTTTVVKLEQDYEMSPQKKTSHSKRGAQYTLMRTLIPDKMGKIAAKISDLPILNEPLPEIPVKPLKKIKVEKPPKEKQRVKKSKFVRDIEKNAGKKKSGPKTNRLLRQLQESEAEKASATFVIKSEPIDAEGEGSAEDTDSYNSFTVTELENANSISGMVETSVERMETDAEGLEINAARVETNSKKEEPRMIKTARTVRMAQNSQVKYYETVDEEQNSVDAPTTECPQNNGNNYTESVSEIDSAKNTTVENPNVQQDDRSVANAKDVREPLIIALPVMIAGVQQVACIPFYPDSEGKITLPNGVKIDAAGVANQNAPSLPVINFDQPFQIFNPRQQSGTVQSAGQQVSGVNDQDNMMPSPKQTVAAPQGSVSVLNPKIIQSGREKQISGQSISLLNKGITVKNSTATKTNAGQTSSLCSK